jgi:hypothetical protein
MATILDLLRFLASPVNRRYKPMRRRRSALGCLEWIANRKHENTEAEKTLNLAPKNTQFAARKVEELFRETCKADKPRLRLQMQIPTLQDAGHAVRLNQITKLHDLLLRLRGRNSRISRFEQFARCRNRSGLRRRSLISLRLGIFSKCFLLFEISVIEWRIAHIGHQRPWHEVRPIGQLFGVAFVAHMIVNKWCGGPAAQTQDSWEMKGQDPNRKHQAHPKRIPCQTRQLKKALLPTATKSLIELHQGDEFVALRLCQSQLRRKRVGVVCQHLQVIGSPGLEANL